MGTHGGTRLGVPAALLVLPLGLGLGLAGCGASGSTAAPSTSAQPSTGAGVVSTASESPLPSTAAASVSAEPAPSGTAAASGPASTVSPAATPQLRAAVVKEIRVADHGTFDRVVVEFVGSFGSWGVKYADKIVEDPTGEPVSLQGKAFLAVNVQNATFDNLFQVGDGVERLSYTGPRKVSAGLPNVLEVADSGDFEAVIGLGIGLDHVAGMKAYRLENPSRLVIDVAH